jgi:hypothetical protein
MPQYAFVKNGQVIRVAEWDEVMPVPADITAVPTNGALVQPGDSYSGSEFGFNPPVSATVVSNYATLMQRARDALDDNATFLAIGSPTNAQALAQIQALTRQVNAVIRLLARQLDSTA